jgi:hypothetical protein
MEGSLEKHCRLLKLPATTQPPTSSRKTPAAEKNQQNPQHVY